MNVEKLADAIVAELFRNGANNEVKRLVIELNNGENGGGWSREGARSAIIRAAQPYVQATASRDGKSLVRRASRARRA